MSRQGWRPPRRSGPPFALLGILLTLIVVLLVGIILVMNGSSGAVTPSASPSTAASEVAIASVEPSSTPELTVEPTLEVTPEVTPEPPTEAPPTTTPTVGPSLAPGQTPKPTLTGFTAPATASCTAPNGSAPAGYIHLTWTASDTTGVRISIDPPAANRAYAYGYADYPWPAVSSADVPFACGSASHLYVITTAHTTGYFQYRYKKVTAIP